MDKYKDIINIKHFDPKYHKRMSNEHRAMEFAPFSALTGFSDEINETGRITDGKIELTEEQIISLNEKLLYLISTKKEAKFLYFIKDLKKEGGSYKEIVGTITKFNEDRNQIIINNDVSINLYNIINIMF